MGCARLALTRSRPCPSPAQMPPLEARPRPPTCPPSFPAGAPAPVPGSPCSLGFQGRGLLPTLSGAGASVTNTISGQRARLRGEPGGVTPRGRGAFHVCACPRPPGCPRPGWEGEPGRGLPPTSPGSAVGRVGPSPPPHPVPRWKPTSLGALLAPQGIRTQLRLHRTSRSPPGSWPRRRARSPSPGSRRAGGEASRTTTNERPAPHLFCGLRAGPPSAPGTEAFTPTRLPGSSGAAQSAQDPRQRRRGSPQPPLFRGGRCLGRARGHQGAAAPEEPRLPCQGRLPGPLCRLGLGGGLLAAASERSRPEGTERLCQMSAGQTSVAAIPK